MQEGSGSMLEEDRRANQVVCRLNSAYKPFNVSSAFPHVRAVLTAISVVEQIDTNFFHKIN